MKKVLLINTNTEKKPYPVSPLGLCMVADSIEKYYQVKVYDGMFDEGSGIVDIVNEFNPDYIGFSIRNIDSMSIELKDFFPEKIREVFVKPVKMNSDAVLILGGSGFSIFPEELLGYLDIDLGVVGDGEKSFLNLLRALDNNEDYQNIDGVVIRNQTKFNLIKQQQDRIHDIKPADVGKYIDIAQYNEKGAYSLQTKRGCSHKCIYCTYPLIEGSDFRIRSVTGIVDEIDRVTKNNPNITIEFVDSTFNDPAGHAENICREIIKRNLKVRMRTMGINPMNSSEELFILMKKAGFTQIDVTPDTASQTMLKKLGKNFTLRHLQKCANYIKKFDIPAMWFFVFGGPGETYETIDESFEFIYDFISPNDLVYVATSLRIYPGTRLHKIALEHKVLKPGQNLFYPVFYETSDFPNEKIHAYLKNKIGDRHNILFTSESRPSEEMLKEAILYIRTNKVSEPMFRTLLRIRKKWLESGRQV